MPYHKVSRDHKDVNEDIVRKVSAAIQSEFPIEGNLKTIDIANLSVKVGNTGIKNVQTKTEAKGTINAYIGADVTLYSVKNKKVIDKKRRIIASVPIMTAKDSFVVNGGSYVIPHQQRLLPGSYTTKKNNGSIETMVNPLNLRNFKIRIDGDRVILVVGGKKIGAYSVLRDLGISDEVLKRELGARVFNSTKSSYKSSDTERFFMALTYGNGKDFSNEATVDLLSRGELDKESTKETLGKAYGFVTPEMILDSIKKLILVFEGKVSADDKDSMVFKRIVSVETMLAEEVKESFGKLKQSIRHRLNNPKILTIDGVLGVGGAFIGSPMRNFITSSESSRMSEEYNPMMMTMTRYLLTPMGRGGVGDTRALDSKTKSIHGSQLGFVDPIVSPEGASVGVTLGLTDNAYVDENGKPAIRVLNPKTKKREIVSLAELWKKRVAYPTTVDKAKKNGVVVRIGNDDERVKSSKDIDYIIEDASDMHSPSTNFIALMENIDSNRANMAQKHIQQAQSLKNREAPNVSSSAYGEDFAKKTARESGHLPVSPVGGVVVSVSGGVIKIKGSDGTVHEVEYVKDMALSTKTFIDHEPKVKAGDKVKKGEVLADSNFTKDGHLALGVNSKIGWVSQDGNRNDGAVVTESYAKRMTSMHMYKDKFLLGANEKLDFKAFISMYPDVVSKWGEGNYSSDGVIREGKVLKYDQPIAFVMKTRSKDIIGSRDKVFHSDISGKIIKWGHKDDGLVKKVSINGKQIIVASKVESPLRIGDKLAARQGNKVIVTNIIPDKDAIKDEEGNPVEITVTSAGVISRTNGGSLIEAGLGKVTSKTGNKFVLPTYGRADSLDYALGEMRKNNVSNKEVAINPNTGKPFPVKVSIGNTYVMRLFKDSEGAQSSVGVGATDGNKQPKKGGKESASSISNMEVNALLANNAKGFLREIKSIKGQENKEFFEAFRAGHEAIPPENIFSNDRYRAYVNQMGVDIDVDSKKKTAFYKRKTDAEIKKESHGRISNSQTLLAKDLSVVKGGLFDESIFGGVDGKSSGHIDLGARIIHPLSIGTVSSLLGVSKEKIEEEVLKNGFERIEAKVKDINVNRKISDLKKKLSSTNDHSSLNKDIKLLNFLEKSKDENVKPEDILFTSVVPVLPPKFRPISVDKGGDIAVNDINLHYQDILPMSKALISSNKHKKEDVNKLKLDLYKAVGALYGTEESPNKKMRDKNVKGILDILSGDSPKHSLNQQTMLRSNQFMSGRAVIVPTRKDLSIDEVEIPEKMGLSMYEPHISRRMSRLGYTPMQTKELIKNKDPMVIKVLHELGKEIPVVYNRAPSLWKHSIVSGYPRFVKSNVININPLLEKGFNADYDGDQMGVHVPITRDGIEDAKTSLLPSRNLFSDNTNSENPSLLISPTQDATLGIYKASKKSSSKTKRVKDINELKKMLAIGDIHYNDEVSLG